ncbi:MAG TPA: TetR family transcriptional regulator [Propionibacteriaceae bacterium]|nr:TetR family transcriptional regulator [Propionibacteriaceae bacterium]
MVRMPLEERRRRLIEAAIVIVGESGLGAASTRAISTHAGMPLAAFHYAFSSQQELMMVALHTLVDREIADHGDLELDGHTQAEAVRSALLMHLTDVDRRLHDYRALQELSLHAQHIPGFEDLPATFRERRTSRIHDKLVQFRDSRQIRFDRPAIDIAKGLVLLADGITVSMLTGRDADELRDSIKRQLRQP